MSEQQHSALRVWDVVMKTVIGLGLAGVISLEVSNHNATTDLHDAVNLNTYKLTQQQQQTGIIQTMQGQVAELQWQVKDLQGRQEKDDEYRAKHGGAP
jgi:hypothetical protein